MPGENSKVVRQFVEAFNARDFETVRTMIHRDFVWYPEENQPETGPFHGGESYIRYAHGWVDAFEGYEVEISELLELGDCVVGIAAVRGTGQRSGAQVDSEAAGVFRLRNGLVIEHRECASREEALALAARPSFAYDG